MTIRWLPFLVYLAWFPGMALATGDADKSLSAHCIPPEKSAEQFEVRLIYGGPPGKPLIAAADGAVVFSDWLTGKGGYRALVLMVDYLLPGDKEAPCLVAYRGELKDYKRAGESIRKGDRLGIWDRAADDTAE